MSPIDSFKRMSEQLINFKEVELIYYAINVDKENNSVVINFNVVCSTDNVISNIKLVQTWAAIENVIRTLYSQTNIEVNFNLVSADEYENEMSGFNLISADEYEYGMSGLTNEELEALKDSAIIIYSNDEFLTSMIKKHTR